MTTAARNSSGQMALVFVHGGQFTATCWQPTIDAIARANRSVTTLAVDLPGRGDEPGDLATLNIGQCVQSVVRQINEAGIGRVVLVGHSMAGITLPGVAAALGAPRVERIVYLACCVPPQGKSVLSTLRGPTSWIARAISRSIDVSAPIPKPLAKWLFSNGMTRLQKREVVAGMVPESAVVAREPVDRSCMPKLPTTWVITMRDRALRPAQQREFIANLGGVDEVIEMDTCHALMHSEPTRLASLLLGRSQR